MGCISPAIFTKSQVQVVSVAISGSRPSALLLLCAAEIPALIPLKVQKSNDGEGVTFYTRWADWRSFVTRLLQIKPGITAGIDIRTGTRSILKYIAKPMFKAFGGALNER